MAASDDYSLDDVAGATAAPATTGDDYALEDAGRPEPAEPPAKASTLGYIGTRALGGFLEGGKWLAAGADTNDPAQSAELAALPSGEDKANKTVYGTTNVPAPNAVARYGGDLAASVGSNPVGAAMAPGATATTSALVTGAKDAGLSPWVGVLAAPLLALLARSSVGAAKVAVPWVANNVRTPSTIGTIRAGRALADVDNTVPSFKQPSAADVDAATTSVRSANAGMTADAAPPFQAGQQIQNDLVARQTALKQARADATQPLAQARDASTAKVDTDPVINVIADKLRTAAGSQAAALNGALDDLQMPSGAMRTQADQLAGARNSLNVRISTAKSAGDNATVKHLSDVRDALDTQVNAAVPEAGQFTSAYQAASKPLDVFTAGKSPVDAVPNVVARDNFGNLNGTPPSEIPDSFLRGSATREKLNQLVEAYGGDKDTAEKALESHLAGVAQKAVRPNGTLDSDAFARVMQPYQKVLGSQPAPSALPPRWNAGNTGVWFPKLQQKFATAQAAQKTLDTMTAQRSITQDIATGGLRNDDGVVTAKSFGDWLKTNKDTLAKSQSPAAVTRLQQIAGAVRRVGDAGAGVDAFLTETVPVAAGAALGGTEGGILGGMLHKATSALLSPVAKRTNSAFSSAIERAALDPDFAQKLVAGLPRAPYTGVGAARVLAQSIAKANSATAPALTMGGRLATSSQSQ